MDFKTPISKPGGEETPQGEKFRQQVRGFLKVELTPEVVKERKLRRDRPYDTYHLAREFDRKLATMGWTAPQAPQWPKEYGGVERTAEEQSIISEELAEHDIFTSSNYGGIQGPVIMRHGSEEMKRKYLPGIARGEISFALGYTEPNAGTDLAALQMRAVRDGDEYVINGQKVYSTGAHQSTHHWLAARTDPDAPKHRGISMFLVDLKTPGITIRPLWTMGGERTNEVFYDDVRVPVSDRVGEENLAWSYIREALGVERVGMGGSSAGGRSILDDLVDYASETNRDGRPLFEDDSVRQRLANLAIETSIRRLFNFRTAWMMSKGTIPEIEAAIAKVWGNELDQRIGHIGTQIMGLYGQLEPNSKHAPLEGRVEHLYLFTVHLSYGGGSHELMRSVIATRGFGLPRDLR